MAVWQFVIDFVPKQFLLDAYGCIPETMLPEDREQGDYFRQTRVGIDELLPYIQSFGAFDKNSWAGTRLYQGEAENDAAVYFDEKTSFVEGLSCRIDVRQPYESFIYSILTLANAFDCQLMARGSRQIFAPTVSELHLTMEQSNAWRFNAWRFAANPLKFLTDLLEYNAAPLPID